MQNDRFETPVAVRSEAGGTATLLHSAQDASAFLLNRWPGKKSEKYRTALQACHDAVAGEKSAMTARRAFLSAGREANVLVKDDANG